MRIYKNGRNTVGNKLELAVSGQKFAVVAEHIDAEAYPDSEIIDLQGKLIVPPFADLHIHLDYVYSHNPMHSEESEGTLFSGIEDWSAMKQGITAETLKDNARKAIRKQIGFGVQYVRTHVDVTDPELKGLRAMQEIQREVAPYMDLQIVAFPQEGMYAYPNGDKCVEEALKMGAEVVGAIPHFEHNAELGRKSVAKAFELAEKYGRLVDIHCDEIDDPMSRFVADMAAEAVAYGNGRRVSASHTCAMGSYDGTYARRLINTLQKANMNFVVCPAENLHLQGRGDAFPRRRGITRVRELMDAGLNVCLGQDSIMDPWYPLGSGNLMNILDIGLHACHLTDDEHIWNALDLITVNGARAFGVADEEYGLAAGKPASFLVLDATNAYEAICLRSRVLRSVRKGSELFERHVDEFEDCVSYIRG